MAKNVSLKHNINMTTFFGGDNKDNKDDEKVNQDDNLVTRDQNNKI